MLPVPRVSAPCVLTTLPSRPSCAATVTAVCSLSATTVRLSSPPLESAPNAWRPASSACACPAVSRSTFNDSSFPCPKPTVSTAALRLSRPLRSQAVVTHRYEPSARRSPRWFFVGQSSRLPLRNPESKTDAPAASKTSRRICAVSPVDVIRMRSAEAAAITVGRGRTSSRCGSCCARAQGKTTSMANIPAASRRWQARA